MGLLEELSFNELTERFERIGIAYSGGLDSTVLLHLIANRIESKEKINALKAAGVAVAESPAEIGSTLLQLLKKN